LRKPQSSQSRDIILVSLIAKTILKRFLGIYFIIYIVILDGS